MGFTGFYWVLLGFPYVDHVLPLFFFYRVLRCLPPLHYVGFDRFVFVCFFSFSFLFFRFLCFSCDSVVLFFTTGPASFWSLSSHLSTLFFFLLQTDSFFFFGAVRRRGARGNRRRCGRFFSHSTAPLRRSVPVWLFPSVVFCSEFYFSFFFVSLKKKNWQRFGLGEPSPWFLF